MGGILCEARGEESVEGGKGGCALRGACEGWWASTAGCIQVLKVLDAIRVNAHQSAPSTKHVFHPQRVVRSTQALGPPDIAKALHPSTHCHSRWIPRLRWRIDQHIRHILQKLRSLLPQAPHLGCRSLSMTGPWTAAERRGVMLSKKMLPLSDSGIFV